MFNYKSITNAFNKILTNDKKRIAILYICTGKYVMFWDQFYRSCEKKFCKNSSKDYFIFTDQIEKISAPANCTVVYQEKLGWPYDTLNRFHFFNSIEHMLKEYDYLFFFNANMVFNFGIKENEILLPDHARGLIGVIHPSFYDRSNSDFPYERNEESEAYIAIGDGKVYYQGCLSGGTASEYLEMCRIIKDRIDRDAKKGMIAVWHDESHLNRYFADNEPYSLHPGYAYPETMNISFKNKIIQLDKARLGGHEFLRS
jgi:hypothetical protein